jgi:hypothetical protein
VRATARCLIIATTVVSWIAISNHCALRAFATQSETTSSCPFHSKPAKPQPKTVVTECCKNLRAVATTPAKIFSPAIIDLTFAKLVILEPPKISFTPVALDTGPPGKTSFLELSRSMRAHAPPFLS